MPTDTLLLADSEIARLTPDGADLQLRFSAACVRRQTDEQGAAPLEGYARSLVLHLTGVAPATDPGALTDAFGRLRDGRLQRTGRWQGDIPLPAVLMGPLTLELQFANGTTLSLDAHALRSEAPAPLPFTESLAC